MEFRRFLETDDCSFDINGVCVSIKEISMTYFEHALLEEADPELLNFISDRVRHYANQVIGILRNKDSAEDVHLPPYGPSPGLDDSPEVTVDPEPVAKERNMKKYRVTLRYPKSRTSARLGTWEDEVMYVFASNVKDAKSKVEGYIRTKLDPREGEPARRFNYLKSKKLVPTPKMQIRTKGVTKWSDFKTLLRYLSLHKGSFMTPLEYFDEDDFRSLLQQSKKRTFVKEISSLPAKQQRLLKAFYFHMAQNPGLSSDTRAMMDDELANKMRKLGTKGMIPERMPGEDPEVKTKPERAYGDYWSVFEPKTEEEERQLKGRMDSIANVFNVAARYGIPARDLRQVRDDMFGSHNEHVESMRKMWKRLYQRLMSGKKPLHYNNKLVQEGDYTDPILAKKYGIYWDEIVKSYLSGDEEYFPFHNDNDPNSTKNTSEAAEWLWEFYRSGPPSKPDKLKQYRNALDHLIEYRNKLRSGHTSAADKDIPF